MPTPLTHDDPAVLGPFRLIARLGSGGMGTVYVARSAGGRTVALKTMHPGIAEDPAARTRFRLEVDAARVIGGQFGAKVFDADPLAVPTPWFATEYVLGPALDEAVEAVGPLPEKTLRALGAALCTALHQLHQSEVVHRDLKPSNILVTAYGPKVIDFGIARAIGDERLTRVGAAVGTPAFMSPEQATGQEHGPAGDVFALAGVLVYAARGSGPFGRGQATDLLYRVRYGEADLGGVPDALVPVLKWCLSKDPAQRPTVGQLASQLHDGKGEFVDQLPHGLLGEIGRRSADVWQIVPQRLPAPVGPSLPETAVGSARAVSRRGLLAVGGVLTAGAATGGGVWWSRGRGPEGGGGSVASDDSPSSTRNLDPTWNAAGRSNAAEYGLVLPRFVKDLVIISLAGASDGIVAVSGKGSWTATTFESGWAVAVDDDKLYRLTAKLGDAELDPHGPVALQVVDVASGQTSRTVARFSATNDQLLPSQILAVNAGVAYLVVGVGKASPLGFLASQTWTLRAVDCASGRTLWTKPLPRREDDSTRLHFTSATVVGDLLVTYQETKEWEPRLVVRSTKTGGVVWDVAGDAAKPNALRCGPAVDGTYVYVGGERLRALRLRDGRESWTSRKATGPNFGPPMLKDGKLYAVDGGAGLAVFAAADGKQLWRERTTDRDSGDGASADWAPIVGNEYAYYKNGARLRAVSLGGHGVARTYRTTADQFFAAPAGNAIVGVTEAYVYGFPMS
ncbi:protein kinase [Streptomyces sp. NPDC102467]|uniref:protein kinase domain-containing protein n=1 Tax=Streptomyces sp. NPDC102467 TaxID=3366179 RepID=UPI00382287A1